MCFFYSLLSSASCAVCSAGQMVSLCGSAVFPLPMCFLCEQTLRFVSIRASYRVHKMPISQPIFRGNVCFFFTYFNTIRMACEEEWQKVPPVFFFAVFSLACSVSLSCFYTPKHDVIEELLKSTLN